MDLNCIIHIVIMTLTFVFCLIFYSKDSIKEKLRSNYPFGKRFTFLLTIGFLVIAILYFVKMIKYGFDSTYLKIALSSFYVFILQVFLFRNKV